MRPAGFDLQRRRLLGAHLLLSPLGLGACGASSGQGSAGFGLARTMPAALPAVVPTAVPAAIDPVADGRPSGAPPLPPSELPPPTTPPRALPDGLREGRQQAWTLPDAGEAYDRMQIGIPAGYVTSRQPWPLLVFLHGAGERGTDVDDVKRSGPPLLLDQGGAYPMIVCSPQADVGTRWQPRRLHALVAALSRRLAVDPTRMLATGLSLGGSGVWRWACEFPGDLAAIAPICGYAEPAAVAAMRRVPVRAYHGELDPFVPLARQQACVAELQRQGGTASLTVYPVVGHDAWTAAYQDPALVPWLLAQRRT